MPKGVVPPSVNLSTNKEDNAAELPASLPWSPLGIWYLDGCQQFLETAKEFFPTRLINLKMMHMKQYTVWYVLERSKGVLLRAEVVEISTSRLCHHRTLIILIP